jgi:hypothetical protein
VGLQRRGFRQGRWWFFVARPAGLRGLAYEGTPCRDRVVWEVRLLDGFLAPDGDDEDLVPEAAHVGEPRVQLAQLLGALQKQLVHTDTRWHVVEAE